MESHMQAETTSYEAATVLCKGSADSMAKAGIDN